MNKKQALLKAAEHRVRLGGYSNFSFRELAKEVGIKSASVHYHFPTKADLGAELAREYTDKFLANLGDPANLYASGKNPISIYVEQFRVALIEDKKMCLCGLLGAETDCLPDKVKVETKRFFQQNLGWLEHAYTLSENHEEVKLMAIKTIAMLEGAMMISKTLDDPTIFLGITELFA